jgi:transposase
MDAPTYQQLLLENQRLREQLARLQETILDLQKRLDEAERSAKRQAAPFSKGPPKSKPKKPGRKSGDKHGEHGHRPPPPPTQVDQVLDAPLPDKCPDPNCGGPIVEDGTDKQFQTEIPREPIHREFTIHCGHCDKCGKKVRGRHPLQTSDATGAAQSQLGPDAQAAIVDLNKRAGMSFGKIADTFTRAFGISLTRGACAQVILRAADLLMPTYEMIKERLILSYHITPDETGWRIGGLPAWLHGWVGDNGVTLYAIDPQRSADVLEKIIGLNWSGSMTHDGFSSYDRFQDASHQQCVDHALRRARGLLEKQSGAACLFPRQVIELFTGSLQERDRLNAAGNNVDHRGSVYEDYTQRLRDLTERCRTNEQNDRFARHLFKHAPSWFLFLLDPAIPATNHRAEQALKTPIVNRKVWGGNRTLEGCKAQAVLCSVLQTCKNLAIDVFSYLSNAFRGNVAPLFT